ncbi:MAG: hypothetical protein ABJA94_09125 [Rhodoglobus sp.]
MSSWRDGLNAAAQADLDHLLDSALAIARANLAKASEFDPFALVVDTGGRLLAAESDTTALSKHPETEELVAATLEQLQGMRRHCRAVALTLNTKLAHERTNAIEVRLEHSEGASLVVLLRYKRPMFGPHLEFGQLSAFPGAHEVWN